ncbi:hypothetical protein JB92DRAFT_2839374, partial [Gautieria morchelliformis]
MAVRTLEQSAPGHQEPRGYPCGDTLWGLWHEAIDSWKHGVSASGSWLQRRPALHPCRVPALMNLEVIVLALNEEAVKTRGQNNSKNSQLERNNATKKDCRIDIGRQKIFRPHRFLALITGTVFSGSWLGKDVAVKLAESEESRNRLHLESLWY